MAKRSPQFSVEDKVASSLLVVSAFLLRPTALGQQASVVAISLVLGCVALVCLNEGLKKNHIYLNRNIVHSCWLLATYYFYQIIIFLFAGDGDVLLFLKEVLTMLVAVGGSALLLSRPTINQLFFRKFSSVIALLGWSSIVTLVLSYFVPLESLQLASIEIKGYEGDGVSDLSVGAIYFPFSMIYSRFSSLDGQEFLRFSHFFREAGIAQAFFCFVLAYESFTTSRRWVVWGAIFGVLTTLSTAGLAVLVLTLTLVFLTRSKKYRAFKLVILPILLGGAVAIILFFPNIGILDKSLSHADSSFDRLNSVSIALDRILSNPWGAGLFTGELGGVSSINLIAATASIGIFGALIQIILLTGVVGVRGQGGVLRLVCCTPIFITALISQPLVGAPLVYIMLFVSFVKLRRDF